MATWEDLQDGQPGQFCFLKVDIVGHSKIVREHSYKDVEDVFNAFEEYVEQIVSNKWGRIWSWAGDGGMAAFFEGDISDKTKSAVEAALEILIRLKIFNGLHRLPGSSKKNDYNEIQVRVAVHSGSATYRSNTGRIHSEAINFVSHLERDRTHVNSISISEETYKEIRGSFGPEFVEAGEYERKKIYTSDKERGDDWGKNGESRNPQIGRTFPVRMTGGRTIQVTELIPLASPAPLLLSWDTFEEGMFILKRQIEDYQPAMEPDICVGVNPGGILIGAFLSGTLRNGLRHVGTIKTGGEGRDIISYSFPSDFRNIRTVIVTDSEIKTGESAKKVIDLLKSKYRNARQIKLAVLTACNLKNRINEIEKLQLKVPNEYYPSFLAFTTSGRIEVPERMR